MRFFAVIKKHLNVLAVFALMFSLALAGLANPVQANDSRLEREALNLIKQERANNKLPALQPDARLADVARRHAQDMVQKNYFLSKNKEGKEVAERVSDAGIRYSTVGEVIKQGLSVSEMHKSITSWGSPERNKMRNADYTHVGVGIAQRSSGQLVMVQVYASMGGRAPSGPPPGPPVQQSPPPGYRPPPGPPSSGGGYGSPLPTHSSLERDALNRINQDRANNNLRPLQADSRLADVARQHAQDMVQKGYFASKNKENEEIADRMRKAGIRYTTVGEVIKQGTGLSEMFNAIITSWGNPDKTKLRNADYTHVGVGIAGRNNGQLVMVQVYASMGGAPSGPPPGFRPGR